MDRKIFEAKLKALGVKRKRSPRLYGKSTYLPEITKSIVLPRKPCSGRADPSQCSAPQFHQWGTTQKRWFSRCFSCRKSYGNVLKNGDAL
jgi:hypothetical protein